MHSINEIYVYAYMYVLYGKMGYLLNFSICASNFDNAL